MTHDKLERARRNALTRYENLVKKYQDLHPEILHGGLRGIIDDPTIVKAHEELIQLEKECMKAWKQELYL